MEKSTQFRTAFNGFNRKDVVQYLEFIQSRHSAQVAQLNSEMEYLRGKKDSEDPNQVQELEKQLAAAREENEILKCRISNLEFHLTEEKMAEENPAQPDPELEKQLAAACEEKEALKRRVADLERLLLEGTPENLAQPDSALEEQLAAACEEKEALKRRVADLEDKLADRTPETLVLPGSELEAYRRAERVERVSRERARQTSRKTSAVLLNASVGVENAAGQLEIITTQLAEQVATLQKAMDDSKQALSQASGDMKALDAEIEE